MQELSGITPVLVAVLLGSIGSLLGGALLLLKKKSIDGVTHILVPFAAGALLGTAFFELLPEALHHAEESGSDENLFLWAIIGILFFYLLERVIHWFQYHRKLSRKEHGRVVVPLVIISDSVHNFIDGIAIAITFMLNPSLGVITTLAIIAHEIPQEIGDFAVLLHEGLSRKKVLIFNLLSAMLAVAGAAIALFIGESIEAIFPYALSITAGFFVYISLANLLPTIHGEEKKGYAFYETIFLLFGVLIVFAAGVLLEGAH